MCDWSSEHSIPQLPCLQQWLQGQCQTHCHCLLPRRHHWQLAQLEQLSAPASSALWYEEQGANCRDDISQKCGTRLSRFAGNSWSLLDPAVWQHESPTVGHCLKGCKSGTLTAKGLVARLVLAKGLSEKGLLLADITAPLEGCQNTSKVTRQPNTPPDKCSTAWPPDFSLEIAATITRTLGYTVRPMFGQVRQGLQEPMQVAQRAREPSRNNFPQLVAGARHAVQSS